ncbi:MAG: molybdenum cofactor guanylyltransferase [Cyanobacteria bacterium J06638_22]
MPNSKPFLAAIVLAGGKSRRMGKDKALLKLGDETLLQRTCHIAAAVCETVSVVTPWGDRYRSELPPTITLIPEPAAEGEQSAGPLMGFLHALPQQQAEWILLLACDLPRLQQSALERWRQDLATLPDTMLACVPHASQGWEPLCGFYRRDCLESLEAFVEGGDRSFQKWLEILPVQPIDIAGNAILFNCNTPEDWERVQTSS